MKYRKKPVVIEAFQWTGGPDQTEDPEWIIDAMRIGEEEINGAWVKDGHLIIMTLEGLMRANPGDYIIQGIKGEIYPCKSDIFEQSYEKVK